MSPTPTSLPRQGSAGIFPSNRRANQRYPITLEIEYKVPDGNGFQRKGFGRTINISSRGMLLAVPEVLPSGSTIEISISWPFRLQGVIPLKLMVEGYIVRSDGYSVAVKSVHHEFHVASARCSQIASNF
jgi:hypothetical protein